jgi:hypothetical protein
LRSRRIARERRALKHHRMTDLARPVLDMMPDAAPAQAAATNHATAEARS